MNVRAEIRKVFNGETNLLAVASLVFENAFVIRNLRIINSDKGVFVAYPSYKSKKGEYKNQCHPITKACREQLESLILNAYAETLANTITKINTSLEDMENV